MLSKRIQCFGRVFWKKIECDEDNDELVLDYFKENGLLPALMIFSEELKILETLLVDNNRSLNPPETRTS
jgi:hypothetical protein